METKKTLDAELHSIVQENNCEVYLNGTTQDILNCICASIKSLAIRIMESMDDKELSEYKEYMNSIYPEVDVMEEYMTALLVAQIMSNLEIVGEGESILENEETPEIPKNLEFPNFSNLETLIKPNMEDLNNES